MEAGDHVGFTWTDYGVISFDMYASTEPPRYCDKQVVYFVGVIMGDKCVIDASL